MEGTVSRADHERFLETLRSWREAPPPTSMLQLLRGVNPPTASMRREIADIVDGISGDRRHYALVTTSLVLRGVLRAINWVANAHASQQQVFGHPRDALLWLRSVDDSVSVDAVEDAIAVVIPDFRGLRW